MLIIIVPLFEGYTLRQSPATHARASFGYRHVCSHRCAQRILTMAGSCCVMQGKLIQDIFYALWPLEACMSSVAGMG